MLRPSSTGISEGGFRELLLAVLSVRRVGSSTGKAIARSTTSFVPSDSDHIGVERVFVSPFGDISPRRTSTHISTGKATTELSVRATCNLRSAWTYATLHRRPESLEVAEEIEAAKVHA
jgi:hypothetical protein